MTNDAKNVIDAFEHLPAAERQQVVRELLRRVVPAKYESLTDDELVAAADALFVELDRAEQG